MYKEYFLIWIWFSHIAFLEYRFLYLIHKYLSACCAYSFQLAPPTPQMYSYFFHYCSMPQRFTSRHCISCAPPLASMPLYLANGRYWQEMGRWETKRDWDSLPSCPLLQAVFGNSWISLRLILFPFVHYSVILTLSGFQKHNFPNLSLYS